MTPEQCSICGVAYLHGRQQCNCNAGPLRPMASNQSCNCPISNYRKKHTLECFEAQIGQLRTQLENSMMETTALRSAIADKFGLWDGPVCKSDRELIARIRGLPNETTEGLPVAQEPKYTVANGRLVNRASGQPIPDDEPVFILRAKDRVAVYAIMAYRAQCTANPEHHDAVDVRVGDFLRFKETHPLRMKSPDTSSVKASEPQKRVSYNSNGDAYLVDSPKNG